MWYYQRILKKLSLVQTGSFRSLRSCRKTKKTRTQSFTQSLYDSNDSKDLVRTRRLAIVLSARSPIAIYRALIYLEQTSSQDKEARIIDVIQTYS